MKNIHDEMPLSAEKGIPRKLSKPCWDGELCPLPEVPFADGLRGVAGTKGLGKGDLLGGDAIGGLGGEDVPAGPNAAADW